MNGSKTTLPMQENTGGREGDYCVPLIFQPQRRCAIRFIKTQLWIERNSQGRISKEALTEVTLESRARHASDQTRVAEVKIENAVGVELVPEFRQCAVCCQ